MIGAKTLAELEISNGEGALLEGLTHFINFLKSDGKPLPATRTQLNSLFFRYIKAVRREQMQRVSDDRVARGLAPLPKRLLL